MWRTPRCATASITAFCTAGVEPIVAASPMPLAPSGLSGVGVSVECTSKRRQLGGGRDAVVGEVRRQRVAVVVVAHLLVQRLADAGGDAAVLLALDEERVEHRAAVVDRDVAQQADLARVEVDLDDGDVGAERERGAALVEVELGRRAAVGRSRRVGSDVGELAPASAWAGTPATPTVPVVGVDDDVGDVGLEQPGGELPGLGRPWPRWRLRTADPPSCSERDPPVPPPVRTRSVSPSTRRDPIHRDAGLVGDEHGVRGLVALAV